MRSLEIASSGSILSNMHGLVGRELFQQKLVSFAFFGLCGHITLVALFALIVIVADPIRPFIISNSWVYWTMVGTSGFLILSAMLRKMSVHGCEDDDCECGDPINPCASCCGIRFLNENAFSMHIIGGFYITMLYGIAIGIICAGGNNILLQLFIAFGIMQFVMFFGLGLAMFGIGFENLQWWKRIIISWLLCIVTASVCPLIMTDLQKGGVIIWPCIVCMASGVLLTTMCGMEFDEFALWDADSNYNINIFKVIRFIVDMHVWNVFFVVQMMGGDD